MGITERQAAKADEIHDSALYGDGDSCRENKMRQSKTRQDTHTHTEPKHTHTHTHPAKNTRRKRQQKHTQTHTQERHGRPRAFPVGSRREREIVRVEWFSFAAARAQHLSLVVTAEIQSVRLLDTQVLGHLSREKDFGQRASFHSLRQKERDRRHNIRVSRHVRLAVNVCVCE